MSSNETTRLNTKTIIADLDEVQARAKTRCLCDADVASFVDDVRRARALAKRLGLPGAAVDVRYHGGAVPNSYRYSGEASFLEYSNSRLSVSRQTAISAPRGISDERRVRLHIGRLADLPEGVEAKLRRSRMVKSIRGGYAYL